METASAEVRNELEQRLLSVYGLTDRFEPPDWDKYEQRGMNKLLSILPAHLQQVLYEILKNDPLGLEEVVLEIGRPPSLRYRDKEYYGVAERLITSERDIEQVQAKLAGRIKTNGRAGIEGTLHRVSVRRDSGGRVIGFTIRIARALPGIAEPLRPYLEGGNPSLLIIGPPGVGKTTLLRDVARILSEVYGRRAAIIDTSGEIAGEGTVPHPIIGYASRFAVQDPSRQAHAMLEAVANHSPRVVIIDEISSREEADVVLQYSRKGVAVVSSIHGYGLRDASENPAYYPLLGIPDNRDPKRLVKPLYSAAIEIVGIGQARLVTDVGQHISAYLTGAEPNPDTWLNISFDRSG